MVFFPLFFLWVLTTSQHRPVLRRLRAQITTYLLEKNRVSHLAPTERTFHSLYYLAAAAAASPVETAEAAAVAMGGLETVEGLREGLSWLREHIGQQGIGALKYLNAAADRVAAGSAADADASVCSESRLKMFAQVSASLAALGASPEELCAAWEAVGATIALGEIEVSAADDEDGGAGSGADGNAAITAGSDAALQMAASCLGVDSAQLRQRLLSRTIYTGRGSNYVKPYTVAAAISCRDGLAHDLYDRLFQWIVSVVNRSLAAPGVAPSDASSAAAAPGSSATVAAPVGAEGADARSIAILDIFGFEALATNSLEQLLINHTNERLQLYFLHQTLHAEMALYASEGVPAPNIVLLDNAACVALLDGKPDGLICLLEDECNLPKPGDANLVHRLFAAQGSHEHLLKPARQGSARRGAALPLAPGFAVAHFAGVVEYDSTSFVSKNSDALHAELPMLLSGGSSPLIALLYSQADSTADAPDETPPHVPTPAADALPPPPPSPAARARGGRRGRKNERGGGGRSRGVAGCFGRQLDSLMSMLGQTTPHYVRCIKPNERQTPGALEARLVLQQLRCGGTPQVCDGLGHNRRRDSARTHRAHARARAIAHMHPHTRPRPRPHTVTAFT